MENVEAMAAAPPGVAPDPVSLYFKELREELEKKGGGEVFTDDIARVANKIIHRLHHQRNFADNVVIEIFDGLYRLQFRNGVHLKGSDGQNIMLHSVCHLEQFLSGYPVGPNWQTTLRKVDKTLKKLEKRRLAWKLYAVKGEPVTCENGHLIGAVVEDVKDRVEMNDQKIAPNYTVLGLETEPDRCWCGAPYCRRPMVVLVEPGPDRTEYHISHGWR